MMTPVPVPTQSRRFEMRRTVALVYEKSRREVPSIWRRYGSMSTSWRCSKVWAWNRLNEVGKKGRVSLPEGGVEADAQPDASAHPLHIADLAVLSWMSGEDFL